MKCQRGVIPFLLFWGPGPLHFFSLFPMPVADLACPFSRERRPSEKRDRDHVFSNPLGLSLCLCPDPAVDIEPRVLPGEESVCPFGAEEFLADKIGQDLAGEDLRQPGVVDPEDPVESAVLAHPALGHEEMEVRMELILAPKV